jgi:hypothetical protein
MIAHYLLAQASPAPTPSTTSSSVDLFLNGLTNFGNITSTDAIPAALNKLWDVAMKGNMYKLVSGLGLCLAVFAVGFWCVKFYKSLEEGGLRTAANDLVLPVALVVLLSNGGANMRDMTIGTRDMLNGINRSVTRTVSAEVDLKTAIRTLAAHSAVKDLIEQGLNNCKAEADTARLNKCIELNVVTVDYIKNLFIKLRAENSASASIASQADFERWQTEAIAARNKRVEAAKANALAKAATEKPEVAKFPHDSTTTSTTPATTSSSAGNVSSKDLDLRNVTGFDSSIYIRQTILSMRGAFIYILEVLMLVTALVGPIFVALSLFPSGGKFLLNWGASFLSIGFCKICYSLISGLSALAMVYAGPENVDMVVASLVLGLFAPVLSFGIASGSGMSILNTIAYTSQSYGVNIGMSSYVPGDLKRDNNKGGKAD